jgi:hypothetical protein
MKIDILKHTIINTIKSVSYGMKKPEKKFFRTILENMLEYKTTVLTKMWDTKEKSAWELKNYYSKHLWKEEWSNLWKKVERIMIKFIWKIDKENNYFCLDTVDINKNSAKKMEWLKVVRDWTEWTLWNWFKWHWISIKWIPLFLKRERVKKDDKDNTITMEIFKEQITKILSIFWAWYWILADRWYDDYKKFKLLIELWFLFCIRLKTNRNVEVLDWDLKWKGVNVWNLNEWNYKVKVSWIEEELYIFVKTLEWFKTPVRVISNINDEKNIERYLKRWEIERIFKTWKQEFNFEKIWTKAIQKTDNLVSLVQLCLWISAYIFNNLNPNLEFIKDKNENISIKWISKKIKSFLKEKTLKLNRNSITNFLAYYMQFIRKMKFYFWKGTLKHCFNSQLSLF